MTLGRLRLSVADARDLAEGALRGIGYHNDEARIIADHIIDAAMCGYEYSGLAKILNVFESEHFRLPRRPMKVLRETAVSLAFDGGNNVGMLALFHAAQATIKKTAAHGIALVSVTDAWMSGRGAYYVEMIAKHGLVAIHTASSSPLVAPPGGIRPVLGTNPIAVTQLIERIKATPRQPGVDDIRIPSERAFRSRERALHQGLEIDRVVFDALVALRAR
jgi:LDH2 family malate/lactate/ureidoglycolate dehydrogenase